MFPSTVAAPKTFTSRFTGPCKHTRCILRASVKSFKAPLSSPIWYRAAPRFKSALALAALSSLSAEEIKGAISSEDIKKVQTIKGVGAKSAQRIVLELKDKYQKEGFSENNSIIPGAIINTLRLEALTALTTLGVSKPSAEKTIDKIVTK